MEKKSHVTIRINTDLHQQAKIRAAETRKTLTEVVEAALRLFLDGRKVDEKGNDFGGGIAPHIQRNPDHCRRNNHAV